MRITAIVSQLLLMLASSCDQPRLSIQNLNDNKIAIIGHGGSGFKSWVNNLPMNSFESIRQGVEESGADGVEMDVQLSADSKLIVFHDEMLEQSTGCKGSVNSSLEKDLTACVYSSFGSKEFQVTSLEEIVRYFSEKDNPPFLVFDLKLYPAPANENSEYLKRFAAAISEMSANYSQAEKIMAECASREMLLELKAVAPHIKLFIYPAGFESGLAAAKELNLYGITIKNDLITKEQVEQSHQNGLRVTIWGTKSKKSNREAVLKNPDFIQTDNIENLSSLLN